MAKILAHIFFSVIFTFLCLFGFGQLRDTSLLTMYSRPFFYNVVKEWGGGIYAGTSDGIYQMKGAKFVKIKTQSGYLKINEEGRVGVDSNGIRYYQQSSMLHLLPFPSEKRDEFHAGDEKYFYITSGGRMYVYEMMPYAYRFRNHSVRTISANFIGTYSGIYYEEQRLEPPVSSFSDGYIREYNGKVFMCTHGLDVFEIKGPASSKKLSRISLPSDYNFVPTHDIRYIPQIKKYIVATGNKLALLDSSLQNVVEIFKSTTNDEIVLLNEIPQYNLFIFAAGNRVYIIDLNSNKVTENGKTPKPIIDGIIHLRSQYLLAASGLYSDLGKNQLDKVIDLRKAHTICGIAENEFVIGTDEGLYLFRKSENKLYTLIPGVEFNRRALFITKNKLYAGSINGLYILDLAQLDNIIAKTNSTLSAENKTAIPIWFILLAASTLLILSALLMQYKRRVRRMLEVINNSEMVEEKPKISRLDIEIFIRESLPTASLKTIISHFNTNSSMVYTILVPDRPGDLIQQLRYEKVKELRREGKTAKEIATVTGLSDSYVRKIWNNLS